MKVRGAVFALVLAVFGTGFLFILYGQFTDDPNDRLYKLITLWEERGYIRKVPPLRPYPPQLLKSLLKEVRQRGEAHDRKEAERYYRSLFPNDEETGRLLKGSLHPSITAEALTETEDIYWKLAGGIDTLGSIGKYVTFTGKFAYSFIDTPEEDFFPSWMSITDESRSGGGAIELDSREIDMSQLGLFGLHFGTDWIYFQAGLMRSSFGPFYDNGAILGPQAPAAGHFSFTFKAADWLTFCSVYLELAAEYKEDQAMGSKTEIDEAVKKYLVLHSLVFYPWDWWNLGILQTVVSGDRFNPVYLIPLQHMFYTQQLWGDEDSSFLGFFSQFDLPHELQIGLVLYVDDWDAFGGASKSSAKGINLNSAQNKFALQIGLSWSPSYRIFRRVSLDYLMITPYTYTHSADRPVYFLAYTHAGEHLGSILEPNSDQITLTLFLTPAEWMDLDLWGRFIRHGNASENYAEGDGSIFDDGYTSTGEVTFYGPSRFLTQSTLEMVLQTGVDLDFRFALRWGGLSFHVGYIFEHVWNRNLESGENEVNNFMNLGLRIRF
jgi:hypothetical protein